MHTSLIHKGLGAHAKNDVAVAMEGEIMSQGEEEDQRRMAGGMMGSTTQGQAKK